MKTTLFIALLIPFFCWNASFAQILKASDLNLNSGGVIYDVADVPLINCYIVVGDFTDIGISSTLTNIAFINKTDLTVNTTYTEDSAFSGIDAPIYSVEVYTERNIVLGLDITKNHIYIGGQFTTINFAPHNKLADIEFTKVDANPISFAVNSWDAQIDIGDPFTFINDIAISNDTMVIAGNFLSNQTTISNGLGAYQIPANTPLNYLTNPTLYANGYNTVKFLKGELFATANDASTGKLGKVLQNGQWDLSINYYGIGNPADNYYRFDMLNDSLMWLNHGWKFTYGTSAMENNLFNVNNGVNYSSLPDPYIPSILDANQSVTYKHYLYSATSSSFYAPYLSSFDINELGTINWNGGNTTPGTIVWDGQVPTPFNEKVRKQLFVEGSKLFVSASNMTSAGGQPRVGLAVYCLEPEDPKDFTVFDTTICAGNVKTYTIPQSQYADGYFWSYTGTGVEYKITTTANPFQPFIPVHINNDTVATPDIFGNSIDIKFLPGATGGTLTVTPYSTCNTTTDYLYAQGKSITLTNAPLPNLTLLSDSMSFTCVRDSFYLVGQSTTTGTTFEWIYNFNTVGLNDSLLLNKTDSIIGNSYHYIYATEPINGCVSSDSVFVYYDTIATAINASNIISTPPVFDCNTSSLSVGLTVPNATIGWDLTANASPPTMSSYTIYDANDSLNLFVYATYAINGCTAQQAYTIAVDQTTIGGTLSGYSNFGAIPIDSVNCSVSSLNLVCDTINANGYNGTAEWIIGGIPSGNSLNLTEADTVGMDNSGTNTYQFITTNTDNGCVATLNATIKFDFSIPFVSAYNGNSSLNCSATNIDLIHLPTFGNVIDGWLDGLGNQTLLDTLVVNSAGMYYYQVQSLNNGCINSDTIVVTQTSELLIDLPIDTLICSGQTVSITALPINNTETTTYTWSTGGTTQSIDVTGGIDNQVTVVAQTASGCIGYDTLNVLVPSPINASFIVSSTCINGAIQVSNVSGGVGSYQFSLDQTSWQSSTVFTNLNYGAYTIYIRDSLSCVYSFNETINDNSSGLDVNFLVSTYNGQGDTLAIVNISDFTGFDSIAWVLPSIASTYSLDDSMVVLSIQTGGWYDVTLIGYQDTCGYSFTKPVFFGEIKPDYNLDYDTLGIQSTLIYPNPTSGNFTVDVEFGIEQNYSIVVTNMNGQPMTGMSVTGVGKLVIETFSFPFGTPIGPYVIHIISDFDGVQKTIILN